MSRGGRFGGAAGQVEPPGREECCAARGGHTEGQKSACSLGWQLVCICVYVLGLITQSWG